MPPDTLAQPFIDALTDLVQAQADTTGFVVLHQYRVAVREAAEALTVHWKGILGRNDVDDTVFWQQTLSPGEPDSGKPKLAWPGDPTDKTNRSMRGGLEPLSQALKNLATGLNLTVRNVTTHTRDELTEQEGMERLAAYSYFARLLDQCEIRRSEDDEGE
ncbi:TIGR02391 family protein [Streptomyces gardneri]|uniref:TIGR02391 family protein n=1 Tax=Streptomyces gardneri TaxID=66892 RepID=UPI00368D0ACB